VIKPIVIPFILCFVSTALFGQGTSRDQGTDSLFSVYRDTTLKVSIHLFNPQEEEDRKKNAVLMQSRIQNGKTKILFRDSISMATLRYKLADMNGDGQNDLLVYNNNVSKINHSYHLYLVDIRTGMLVKVHSFERVLNPVYNWKKCMIAGFEIYERRLILRTYGIDKKGILYIASGVW
jgi:hypothetical protein